MPACRAQCEPGDQAIEQLGGRDDLAAVGRAAALEPGEGQDVLDEVAEPVGLGAERLEVRPLRRLASATIPSSSISV